MKVTRFFLFICILTTVICEVKKDEGNKREIRYKKELDGGVENPGKYDPSFEEYESKVEERRRILEDSQVVVDTGEGTERRNNGGLRMRNATTSLDAGICQSADIKKSIKNLNEIENCVVIEGFLRISEIDSANDNSLENIALPKLREITGYLLISGINGLESLKNLLPNLEVIRGENLPDHYYALTIYQMPNLRELGLKKLIEITRGGVRIEKNPTLCYVETINWNLIAGSGDIFIKYNKARGSCPGCSQCKSSNHCWTSEDCQVTIKPQCHSECLGWCYGIEETSCYVCKHFRHEGKCVPECPKHLYGYLSRRCITREECSTMKLPSPPNSFEYDETIWRPFNGSCITQCPAGFEDYIDPNDGMACRECSGPCSRTVGNMTGVDLQGGIDSNQDDEFDIPSENRSFPTELAHSLTMNAEVATYSSKGSPNDASKISRQSTSKNLPQSIPKLEERKRAKNNMKRFNVSADGICPSTDIRNKVDNFELIQNCVIIEGFLQIVLIDRPNETSFENVTLPKLREITGYLLLYRVNGLKSLTNLFPNLEVIRGQNLLTDYALMVYEMPNLQELGLRKLVEISRGGVRIEKNPTLCYVDTVNWNLIVGTGDIFIKTNKAEKSCPGCSQCKSSNHCWTSKDCQVTIKPQCHSECLGWCYGIEETSCYVCKHFRHEGKCVPECPKHLYGYLSRRCITQTECLTMKLPTPPNSFEYDEQIWRPFNGSCITQCPTGYENSIDANNVTTCKKCPGSCRRVLSGETIRNTADAQRYRGMNVIQGGLEFHIENGNRNIMDELIESFGEIEEITGYLKVMHSFPITSLAFFKKLRVIKGEPPDTNNASLSILDNPNLSNLFAKGQKIDIQRGRLFFHYNPKLCFSKIEELGDMTGIQNFSKVEVDPESNGEKVACNIVNINIEVNERGSSFATIAWNNYVPSDGQHLLGYILNYMATENKNITVFDSNFCGNNTWQSVDVDIPNSQLSSTKVSKTITGLKPYTNYAIYVKTYISRNDNFASPVGQSEINFFRTQSDIPSSPTNLSSYPASDTEIMIRWGPPEQPNGPIGYYLISGFLRKDDRDLLETRDYCKYGLVDETIELIADVETITEAVTVKDDSKSCCKKDPVPSKPTAPKNFEIMCHENLSISMFVPGEKNFCRSSGISNLKPVVNYGVYEVFSANVTADNSFYLAKNLTHYSTYTISVRACGPKISNDMEQCSEVQYTTTRTNKREGADDVHNLEARVINNTTVTISWDPIENPNGLTVTYTIEYTNLDVKDARKMVECRTEKEIRERRNTYDIQKLSPGKYNVRVRSTSLAGDGRFSEMAEFEFQVHRNNSTGVVLGLCLTIVAVAIAFVLCLMYRRRQNKRKQIRLIASVNPDYIETKYVLDDWEVPREDVQVLEELGLGNFGMVYHGILNGTRHVAIKTISETANLREKNEFLNEASVMKNFSTFHIIKLLGVVSIGTPPFVIMELMENGDLKTYLRKIRDTQLVPNFSRICRMAAEIADGMAYLESKKFVHRDLAARNCMVSKDLVCKIGDFGMARDIYETDYYKIGKKGLLPIRWMAPENLSDGVFTSDSDVWSYGVVLYEILTLAEIPYQGFSNEEVLNYVLRKGTVDIPKNCPEVIYKILERCFKWRPNDRPTFLEIVSELEPFLSQDFCTASFYHSSEGIEIRNSGVKKVYHNAAPIRFYFGNETARWVKDFEDNVMLLDQTKAGSSRGRIFKNGFQQFGNLSAMEDVSLDR